MGFDFKNILKQDEDSLVIDKKKQAVKALIILSVILLVALIVVIILKNLEDVDETRRLYITKDIQNMRTYVQTKATEKKENPSYTLPGLPLDNEPYTMKVNGVEEEYRYGYYYLQPTDYADMTTALLLPDEWYIVNYDTLDVVNYTGIKYQGRNYYSIDDLLAIEAGQLIPSDNTIIIKTADDMKYLHEYPNANFKLAGNIDMAKYNVGEGWEPVKNFTGKFDGRGYTINNLTVYRPTQSYIGLFAEIKPTGKVVNLTLKDANVTGEDYTGIVAGTTSGTIRNVILTNGSVTGVDKVGAIAGSLQQGSINNTKVNIHLVNGETQVGGLVGVLNSGTVYECLSLVSTINASQAVGGLAGSATASATSYINECAVNFGDLTGSDDLGGLVGKIEILTPNTLFVSDSYAVGNITTGKTNMGGLIGYVRTAAGAKLEMEADYAAVAILNKVSTSGGAIGYSSIAVTSPSKADYVFWEKNIAVGEVLESVGTSDTNNVMNFEAKTADEMLVRAQFTNWDFDIWAIDEHKSRPYLKFENTFKENVQEIIKKEE